MNCSSRTWPVLALAVLMSLIAGFVVIIAAPTTAQAQDIVGISATLKVSPMVSDQPFRTVAVALDPGQSGLAALGAALVYDTNAVEISSCAVSEAGACNVTDDSRVLVSVLNLSGLKANEQLLTINFEALPGTTGQTSFELIINTAVTARGEHLTSKTGDTIDVELAAPVVGSLTGIVIAEDSETALFDIDVCITHDITRIETCTTSSGLGNWRIDSLATGTYSVAATDPTKVYAPLASTGSVVDGQTASADDLVMAYIVDDAEPDTIVDEEPAPEPTPLIVPDTAIVVVYKASIIGQVTGLRSEAPLETVQVCATQPHVLHQSCAATDAHGMFALAGLSTGNYWVEVVDPLGRVEQIRPRLVGVNSDQATRTGVDMVMRSTEE